MIKDKELINGVIECRAKLFDPVRKFATRNKASPPDNFTEFQPFKRKKFDRIFNGKVDGVKLKFKYAVLFVNGRR